MKLNNRNIVSFMTDVFPEPIDDGENQPDRVTGHTELSPIDNAILAYDSSRQQMLDSVSALFAEPSDDQKNDFIKASGLVIKNFMACVELIAPADDISYDTKIDSIARLMLEEDSTRLALFQELLEDNEEYEAAPYHPDTIMQVVTSSFQDAESNSQLVQLLGTRMGEGIEIDIDMLCKFLPSEADEKSQVSQKETLFRKVGSGVVDVVKVSVGVAGGILIARAFSKRN